MQVFSLVTVVGLLAQGLFSARILVQWILSEKARKVLSPTIFWQLSLGGSILLFLYGWLRNDFSILVGQLLGYYVYLWNLKMKGSISLFPAWMRVGLLVLPLFPLAWVGTHTTEFFESFLASPDVPLALLIYGTTGQTIFSLRFLYQWWYSRRAGESLLPPAFWLMSLTGSFIIVTYAIFRLDVVLILGQSMGFVAYSRNLWIYYRSVKTENR